MTNRSGALGLVRCPSDRGILTIDGGALLCRVCGAGYPWVDSYWDMMLEPEDGLGRELQAFYEADYPWDSKSPPWKAAQVLSLLSRERRRYRAIVDAGCGTGEVLRLVGEGLEAGGLIGVDWCRAGLRQALEAERWPADVVLLRGDVSRLPLADGAAHLLLAIDILEHLPDPEAFLREATRVADELVVKVPVAEQETHYTHCAGHLQFLRIADYRRMLEATGWQVLKERFPIAPGFYQDASSTYRALREVRRRIAQSAKHLLGVRKWYMAHARRVG